MGSISASGTGCAVRTRVWGRSIISLALLPLLAGAGKTAQLEVQVEKLRNARGVVHLCLTARAEAFPDCRNDPTARKRSLPAAEAGKVLFTAVEAGTYALALVHDENGNGKLDTFMAVPREGYGFSRDAPVRFGPPRFAQAQFRIVPGENVQRLRVRYLL